MADLLSHALNFPTFVNYNEEDEALSLKIQTLWWITPELLEAKFDIDVRGVTSYNWNDQSHSIFHLFIFHKKYFVSYSVSAHKKDK